MPDRQTSDDPHHTITKMRPDAIDTLRISEAEDVECEMKWEGAGG